jgi:hypothetical protein
MARAKRRGVRRRTGIASVEMTRQALNDAAIYATIVGGATFVLAFLSRLPILGTGFGLLHLLVSSTGYLVAGFLVTAHIHRFYHGPTRTLLACHFGLGVATAITVGITVATLVAGLLLLASDGSEAGRGFVRVAGAIGGLIGHALGDFFPQLITGTLLAVLGSFVAFDRDRIEADVVSLLPRV